MHASTISSLGYVCLGGIRSTGLTASMALAEEALALLQQCGLVATPKASDELRSIRVTNLGEAFARPYQGGSSGAIVCHCERTTSNEIVEACTAAPAATTLDGIRRRTRALSGRCQGFYCSAEVCALAANASGKPMSDWLGDQ